MTRRAFLLGLAMAAWVNLWPAYTSLIAHSSRADYAQLSEAFLVPFFCLLGLNSLLRHRGTGLSPSELLAVSCMGMVAALMQGEWQSATWRASVWALPSMSSGLTETDTGLPDGSLYSVSQPVPNPETGIWYSRLPVPR